MAEQPINDVTQAVRSRYGDLTTSQKRIAEAIVEDPEFVAFATVDKLAARLGVASSTIVRFAYKLGLDGFPDLQERVRTVVRQQYRDVAQVAPGEGTLVSHLGDTPFAEALSRDQDNLTRTVRELDRATLERTVEVIARARRVFVCGDLTSYSLAYFTAIAVGRARPGVRLVRADAEGATALIDMGSEDALVAFSFPPYSRNVLSVVKWAKRRDASTVAITDAPFSPVGQRVDTVLAAHVSGIGPQNTLVPGLAVANAVVNGLILGSDDDAILSRYREISELAEEWDLFVLGGDDA